LNGKDTAHACALAKNVLLQPASRYTGRLYGKHTLHEAAKLRSIAHPLPEDGCAADGFLLKELYCI